MDSGALMGLLDAWPAYPARLRVVRGPVVVSDTDEG